MCIVTAEPRAAQRRRNLRHPPRFIHQGLFTFSRYFFSKFKFVLNYRLDRAAGSAGRRVSVFRTSISTAFPSIGISLLFLPGRRNLMIHERYLTRWVGKPSVPIGLDIPVTAVLLQLSGNMRMSRRRLAPEGCGVRHLHGSVPRLTVSFATVEKEEPVVLFPQKHYRSQSPSARRLHPRVEK